jgi:signal transduction histidine kinase
VNDLLPIPLFASAALAGWVATVVQRRPSARGAVPFLWLTIAIAWWCAAGAFHALAGGIDQKVAWAKLQYVGIASVPPLWLYFTAQYAGMGWFRRRLGLVALWIVPVLTMLAAASNEWHRALWPFVGMTEDGAAVYGHGWWFWIAAAFNYVAVLVGGLLVARALRVAPPPYRGQHYALLAAALLPLAANLVYVSGRSMAGFDPTPHAFAYSSLLFMWALFRHHLFDLVPVAREMVVDSLGDAVIVIDPVRRVLDMNATARELAGRPTGWLGRPVEAVLPFLRTHPLSLEPQGPSTLVVNAEAAPTYYDLRLMPVRIKRREHAAWVLLLRDITEQRRAAAERAALAARVQEQQQRESLSVLAGGLAHDFNNLLAGIVGNADLLALKLAPSSDMGNSVGAILLGAQRAADLVDKMLAYAGERHGTTTRLDLDRLVRDLLDLLEASAARHCVLHYEGEPGLIDGDATQIRQVAMNLIINAAEAVEESTGVVRVRVGIEHLSAPVLAELDGSAGADPGTFVCLDVRDNGPGIAEDTQQRIFNPFFTTKAGGHGLGLAAVQGIVRGHRGALRVDSVPGFGARFRCWFPLADQQAAEAISGAPVGEGALDPTKLGAR